MTTSINFNSINLFWLAAKIINTHMVFYIFYYNTDFFNLLIFFIDIPFILAIIFTFIFLINQYNSTIRAPREASVNSISTLQNYVIERSFQLISVFPASVQVPPEVHQYRQVFP